MDQQEQNLNIHPDDRFRAGDHTSGLAHENPPLRPHGVLDPGHPDLPAAGSRENSQKDPATGHAPATPPLTTSAPAIAEQIRLAEEAKKAAQGADE